MLITTLLLSCLPPPGGADDSASGAIALSGRVTLPADTQAGAAGATVGLVSFDPDRDDPQSGAALVSTGPLGAALDFVLELPAAPSDAPVVALDGVAVAVFALAAWEELDGDGAPGPDDRLVGAAPELFVWLDEEPSGALSDAGLGAGWQAVDYPWWEEDAQPGGVQRIGASGMSGLDLPGNLLPHQPGSLDGALGGTAVTATDVALTDAVGACTGLAASDTWANGPAASGAFSIPLDPDGPAAGAWDAAVLDDCGRSPVPLWQVDGAVLVATAYVDLDGDDARDPAEQELGESNTASASWVPVYLRPTGLGALAYAEQGGGMGWQIVEIGGLGYADFVSWDAEHSID